MDVVHRRLGLGGGEDQVRAAVTGEAGRGLLVAVFAGGGVDPELVPADSVGMAGGALLGQDLRGELDFMRGAVTTGAGRGSEQAVRTPGHLRNRVGVAGGAGRCTHRLGVGILFHAHMAGGATQGTVHAAFVFGGVHVQAAAGL
jgi:hypothetical protein